MTVNILRVYEVDHNTSTYLTSVASRAGPISDRVVNPVALQRNACIYYVYETLIHHLKNSATISQVRVPRKYLSYELVINVCMCHHIMWRWILTQILKVTDNFEI